MRNTDRAGGGWRVAAAVLASMALAGCVGYRLGASLPPGVSSIHVPPFTNQTGEPQVEIEATRAALQELQRQGSLRIATAAESDAVLAVELVKYDLSPLRYERDSSRTTREYRLRLTARLRLTPKSKDSAVVDRYVSGESTFIPGTDLSTAKLTALPAAARDLAHQIVKSITDHWE